VIPTLAVDGGPAQAPLHCTKCNTHKRPVYQLHIIRLWHYIDVMTRMIDANASPAAQLLKSLVTTAPAHTTKSVTTGIIPNNGVRR